MKSYFCTLICVLFINALFAQSPEKMDELITAYALNGKFNGNVLVAQKGKVMYQKGVGFIHAEENRSHNEKTIFQIGSITKQITAAVIMQLVQEKKISLQDKLQKYFSGFPNGDKITIEHMLTHTSGIFNYTNDEKIMSGDVTKHYTQEEMLNIFRNYKPDFEPGTKWNYSNSAYSLLGFIIKKVTGKKYEQVVRERIFNPLGMTNSGFNFTGLNHINKAKGYFSLATEKPIPAPIVDSTIAYSAGSIYSTTEDLLKWERAISTNQVLSPGTWKTVFTPYKNKYGYGWSIDSAYGKLITAHSGGIHGFASYILRVPEEELVVILLDNASSTSLSQISNALAAIALNKSYTIPEVRKTITLDTSVLNKYVGEYQLAPTFFITVRLKENSLEAQATGQQAFDLFAEKENLFFVKVVEASIEFIKDDEGKVTELILHQNGQKIKGQKIK